MVSQPDITGLQGGPATNAIAAGQGQVLAADGVLADHHAEGRMEDFQSFANVGLVMDFMPGPQEVKQPEKWKQQHSYGNIITGKHKIAKPVQTVGYGDKCVAVAENGHPTPIPVVDG